TGDAPAPVRRRGEPRDVECLAGDEVGGSEQQERHGIVERARRVLAPGHLPHGVGKAMEPRLRQERVAVGWERALLDDDAVAAARRPVERDRHEMKVHRQRIHHHYFVWPGAGEPRDGRGDELVVGQPGALALVVAEDRTAAPRIQLREDVVPGAPGHEAERMTREVQLDYFWEDELVAEARQRIGSVLRA